MTARLLAPWAWLTASDAHVAWAVIWLAGLITVICLMARAGRAWREFCDAEDDRSAKAAADIHRRAL